ncbi:MAG: coenzyme F420-0:L-glutamate ligase, partial [Clostridia bacterium]|nr:coenzyme F420-0:L-glutamate ligase [Clostridia bacterium]
MARLPAYVGVSAFGIKIGVVVPGGDMLDMVYESLAKCNDDGLLDSGDTVCVTESVVARAQNNYVTVDDVAREAREKLELGPGSTLGILFPILSRNRFSLVLKGLARAVPEGAVVVQLSQPADEVGNPILPWDFAERLGKADSDVITLEDIGDDRFKHPVTGVDYIDLYQSIIEGQGASSKIYLCNNPLHIGEVGADGIIVATIHNRERLRSRLASAGISSITLQELCNSGRPAWSEWGLLGSNMSSGDRLKLAPRHADELAIALQARVAEGLGKSIEVIVYGDGAYR